MQFDATTVSFIASILTLLASLTTLLVTSINSRWSESRTQYRSLLKDDIVLIGEHIHEIMSLSNISVKKLVEGRNPDRHLALAKIAATQLKARRRKIKYSLWALNDGLNMLTRLPDWISHKKSNPYVASLLLNQAERLRLEIDEAIRDAIISGSPPGIMRKLRIRLEMRATNNIWRMR